MAWTHDALTALDGYVIGTTIPPPPGVGEAPNLLYISEQHLLERPPLSGPRPGRRRRRRQAGLRHHHEAIANDTALLYTSRGRFVEYDVLVSEMPRFLRAQFIEQEDC